MEVTDAVGPTLAEPTGEVDATVLDVLDDARAESGAPGRRHAALRDAAPQLAEDVAASGQPSGVTTGDLAVVVHRSDDALGSAARSPAPTVHLTHRMVVVQWDTGGRTRTLLWCPDDPAAVRTAPVRRRGSVAGHLRALGIDPAHVELVVVPDLRHRDLRPLLGTTAPAPDLGAHDAPVTGLLPNATLVVADAEWRAAASPHPLEVAAYRTAAFAALPSRAVVTTSADLLLGPGVALVHTPGRTPGTVSLVVNTDGGPWVASANGVAADAWAPRASRIAGLRHRAVDQLREVIGHRTPATDAAAQHDAMVLERRLAAPSPDAPFPRCFPVAELTAHRGSPGLRPSHVHGRITHGLVRGDLVVAASPADGSAPSRPDATPDGR